MVPASDIRDLVKGSRIHGSLYRDPAVFQRELDARLLQLGAEESVTVFAAKEAGVLRGMNIVGKDGVAHFVPAAEQ